MTAQPGWYPDPEGSQGQMRYWNGQQWAPRSEPPRRGNRTLPVVVGVLVLVVALAATFILWPRSSETASDESSARPTGSQWDEGLPPASPSASPSPSPQETGGETVPCPRTAMPGGRREGNRLHGGGISVEIPDGFDGSSSAPVLQDQIGVLKQYPNSSWGSLAVVGRAPASAGFTDLETTSAQVIECHITSGRFGGYEGHETFRSAGSTIAGRPMWIRGIQARSSTAPGGGATYIVMLFDLGDPEGFAVYWTGVVDADTDAQDAIIRSLETIEFD